MYFEAFAITFLKVLYEIATVLGNDYKFRQFLIIVVEQVPLVA